MVEVKVKELKYLKDLPLEMLQDALDAGELRAGSTVGLIVQPVGVVSEDALIELKLTERGQEELIRVGAVLSVEQNKSFYVLSPEWRTYLEQLKSVKSSNVSKEKIVSVVDNSDPTIRPESSTA